MGLPYAPLVVTLWQDVLCPWCFVADTRLEPLRSEFGAAVEWRFRPFPTRVNEAVPTSRQRRNAIAHFRRAALEPEGRALSAELWDSGDAPRSSVPPLAALEAARLQGGDPIRWMFARALQRAALIDGLNVSRSDVVLELASGLGLDMGRFSAAFASDQMRRLVLTEHRYAAERGVARVPALVLGNRWLLTGLRTTDEYRRRILECLRRQVAGGHSEPLLH